MIFQAPMNIFLSIVDWVLSPLGNITWNLDISFIQPVVEFFKVIFYFLPMQYIFPLIALTLGILGFKVSMSLLRFLSDVIPLW